MRILWKMVLGWFVQERVWLEVKYLDQRRQKIHDVLRERERERRGRGGEMVEKERRWGYTSSSKRLRADAAAENCAQTVWMLISQRNKSGWSGERMWPGCGGSLPATAWMGLRRLLRVPCRCCGCCCRKHASAELSGPPAAAAAADWDLQQHKFPK